MPDKEFIQEFEKYTDNEHNDLNLREIVLNADSRVPMQVFDRLQRLFGFCLFRCGVENALPINGLTCLTAGGARFTK